MRAIAKILRANRAKVKFCEHLKILMDHSIPLLRIYNELMLPHYWRT